MNIDDRFEIIDLCLYDKKSKILIITDIHIGFEESLNRKGVLVPKFQAKDIINRLNKIISKIKIKNIIILGDLVHDFGKISLREQRDLLSLLALFTKNKINIIYILGNHDTILKSFLKQNNINVKKHIIVDKILYSHGDKLINCKQPYEYIIIGHDHPAITIYDSNRREKFKCFLTGFYKSKKLLVLPSFNNLTEGSDILKEKFISPYLTNAENIEIIIIGDKPYYFGKLENLFFFNSNR